MHTSAAGFCCPVLATLDTGQPPIGDVSVLRALSRQRTAGPPRFNTWMLPGANPTFFWGFLQLNFALFNRLVQPFL